MFSSNSLIQLVFAYEDDTFYTDNMMSLSLDQYIWIKLHDHYDTVYFAAKRDGMPVIYHYGDKGADMKIKRSLLGNSITAHLDWIIGKLKEPRKKSAIVFSLPDFCDYFVLEKFQKKLGELAASNYTGTVVLKASPLIEKSRSYFIEKKNVFSCLNDMDIRYIRDNKNVPLYHELNRRKKGSCFFLNVFTKDRIAAVVKHIIWNFPDRFASGITAENIAEFLFLYLNNRRLQWRIKLFENDEVLFTHYFNQLYKQLENPRVWRKVTAETEILLRDGGETQYLVSKNISTSDGAYNNNSDPMFIMRDHNSPLRKFLMLAPYEKNSGYDGSLSDNIKKLFEIERHLTTAYNCPENDAVVSYLDKAYSYLQSYCNDGDAESYRRMLVIIDFCAENMYIAEGGEKEKRFKNEIIKEFNDSAMLSVTYYRSKKALEQHKYMYSSGIGDRKLLELFIMKESNLLPVYEDLLNKYDISMDRLIDEFRNDFVGLNNIWEDTLNNMKNIKEELNKLHDKLADPENRNDDAVQNIPQKNDDLIDISESDKDVDMSDDEIDRFTSGGLFD